jgi:hypothetical protein
MPTVLNYFFIREPVMGSIRVVHKTRDSAFVSFNELIADGDFDDCIELIEVVVNDRGRVIAEAVTHSYSKVGRLIVTHVISPLLRPVPVRAGGGGPLVNKDGPLVPLTLGQ